MQTHVTDARIQKIIESREGFKRIGRKMLGDLSHAEDLAQETSLRMLLHRDRVKADGEIVPYGYRTAYNLGHDLQRKARRVAPGGLDACEPSRMRCSDPDPVQAALCRTAMACLGKRQFAIVRLHYWEGYTTAEIGRKLGITEGLVQVSLCRARKKMRERLGGGRLN